MQQIAKFGAQSTFGYEFVPFFDDHQIGQWIIRPPSTLFVILRAE